MRESGAKFFSFLHPKYAIFAGVNYGMKST
jgi:hypothetical protein